MKNLLKIRIHKIPSVLITSIFFFLSGFSYANNQVAVQKALELRTSAPDSAMSLLNIYTQQFLEEKDTLNTIRALKAIAKIAGQQVNYKESHNASWKALELAKEANLRKEQVTLFQSLGQYYSYYHRKEMTFEFYREADKIIKELAIEKGTDYVFQEQKMQYYLIAGAHMRYENYELAQRYIDTLTIIKGSEGKNSNQVFLKFWQGRLHNCTGKYKQALLFFHQILPAYESSKGAQVGLYKEMGKAFTGIQDYEQSKKYFLKAITTTKKFNSHFDNLPEIYEKLAEVFFELGDQKNAYQNLKISKELEVRYFDSRSESSLELMEIKNEFRRFKEIKEQEQQQQKLKELEHKNELRQLEEYLFLATLLIVIIGGYFLHKKLGLKIKQEKQKIERENKLVVEEKKLIEQEMVQVERERKQVELEKENVLKNVEEKIETKNKELVTSTLKLIEKDKILTEIKDRLVTRKSVMPDGEVEKMVHQITSNKDRSWEEFEARFTSVNKDFYKNLSTQYPNLTQGDKKLCALIKLNFSSKEIANLMNMSVNSVHTTRSRLRKKLSLDRKKNLSAFIASF